MRSFFPLLFAAGIIFSAITLQAQEFSTDAIDNDENMVEVFFDPRHKAILFAEVSERVARVVKEFGESFSEGEPLLFLDDDFYQLQYKKYEAQLAHAKASCEEAEILYRKQSGLKSAKAQLATIIKKRDSLKKIVEEGTNLKPFEAEQEVAQQNLESTERLYEDNAVSGMSLEEARRDFIVAQTNLANFIIKQELELRDAEDAVVGAELNLDMAEANQKPALESARKNLAIAQFNRDSSLEELKSCTIQAPFNGRIVKVLVNEHELVQRGDKLLEVIDDRSLLVTFMVPVSNFDRIHPEQKVDIVVAETGHVVTGRISHTAAVIDSHNEVFDVRAEIDNPQGLLRVGMSGWLKISDIGKE